MVGRIRQRWTHARLSRSSTPDAFRDVYRAMQAHVDARCSSLIIASGRSPIGRPPSLRAFPSFPSLSFFLLSAPPHSYKPSQRSSSYRCAAPTKMPVVCRRTSLSVRPGSDRRRWERFVTLNLTAVRFPTPAETGGAQHALPSRPGGLVKFSFALCNQSLSSTSRVRTGTCSVASSRRPV